MNLAIVYEDQDLLAINKPSGLLTHPANRKDKSESVVGWIIEKYPEIAEVQDQYGKSLGQWTDLRPGIIHRLDKETSGLLLIAKNQEAFDYLKTQFQERKVKKTYLALVHGRLKEKSGIINLPLGKLGTKQTTQIHGKKELAEKSATTNYEVLNYFALDALRFTLLEVAPQTGRTHQIRVHLNALGHPVVCDPLYGGKMKLCPPELGRLFLHAQKLEFTTPSGQSLILEADPPPELTDFLNSSIVVR